MKSSFIIKPLFLLISALCLFTSCGSGEKDANPDFEDYLSAKEAVSAEMLDSEGITAFPSSAVYFTNREHGYCLAYRKSFNEGKTRLQLVKMDIIESKGSVVIVKGIDPKDKFYQNPWQLMIDMAKKDKIEARKRFLPYQKV